NLTFDAAGNLYGTTSYGGGSGCGGPGCGVVLRLKPNPRGTWTYSTLHVFTGADGAHPRARLNLRPGGALYGTTLDGGIHHYGAVFKLTPNADGTWTESVLYSFKGGADGGYPTADVVLDAAGNLYGTTSGAAIGGPICSSSCDAVFKLARNP